MAFEPDSDLSQLPHKTGIPTPPRIHDGDPEPQSIVIDIGGDDDLFQDPVLVQHESGQVTITWPNGKPLRIMMAPEMLQQFVEDRNMLVELAKTLAHRYRTDHPMTQYAAGRADARIAALAGKLGLDLWS